MTIELAKRLEDTPAASVAGVLAKMQIAISLYPRLDDTSGFHEDFALAVLRDGSRLFGETAEART